MFGKRRPKVEAVLDRAICIDILLSRLCLEDEKDAQDAANDIKGLFEFLSRTGLRKALSAREKQLITGPHGSWNERDAVDASWRRESLGVLLWALGKLNELPSWDEQLRLEEWYSGRDLFELKMRGEGTLRPPEAIDDARECAEIWHWRSRTTQALRERPDAYEEVDLEAILFMSSDLAHKRGYCAQPIDGDFPALGKAYRDLDEPDYANLTSIAIERHYALNWLCGYSSNWDKVPTGT